MFNYKSSLFIVLVIFSYNSLYSGEDSSESNFNIETNSYNCDISKIDKKLLVRKLYDNARRHQCNALINFLSNFSSVVIVESEISDQQIEKIIKDCKGKIGSINNIIINIDISENFFDTTDYNKINGKNAAETVITKIRKDSSTTCVIQ